MIYRIYKPFFSDVEKKLNRIGKKCRAHGNDFVFNNLGEVTEERKVFGKKRLFQFVEIEVEGTARIDDWEFIAVVEVHECGNIIRRYNNDIEIPTRFEHTENVCEHCGVRRFRNNLYIIHNVKTDEWKQVGKSCLKLYTGGLSAEYVGAYMDGITELEERDGYCDIHGEAMIPVTEIIAYARILTDKIGYFNANAEIPTKRLVGELVSSSRLDKTVEWFNKLRKDFNFEVSDFEIDEKIEARVAEIIEYYKNVDDTSEFMRNVKIMLSLGYATPKNIGFLCYLPEGYDKHMRIEREKRERLATEVSEHFGKVNQRFKDMKVRYIKCLTSWENQFGVTYFCKVVLEDGHVLYWAGSGFDTEVYDRDKQKYVEVTPDKISFTVKSHGEYNGMPQTKITRCRIVYKKAEA